MSDSPLLSLTGIRKRFPGVLALDEVSLEVKRGEVHALVGENGAGKSTLMKVVAGVHLPDSGTIMWDGATVHIHNPRQAMDLGIATIFQELSLVPDMTVAENIFMGRFPGTRISGLVDKHTMFREAQAPLSFLESDINPRSYIAELSIAERQVVEIARAISCNARLILMDEPTSSLSTKEIESLFSEVRTLKQNGVSVVYISHRLEEVFDIADRVTVLRDGRYMGTITASKDKMDEIVTMMVGRKVDDLYPPRQPFSPKEVILEVKGLTRRGVLHDVSFQLHEGEVLCVSGLVGAGKTELARTLFGLDKVDSGQVRIRDRIIMGYNSEAAMRLGLGMIPEERQEQALFQDMSVTHNISVGILKRLCKYGVLNKRQEAMIAQRHMNALNIKTPSIQRQVKFLSGGNQQKVVLARWLETAPRVLILDEPTRGIDVGAKAEVHRHIRQLADKGIGILLFSSEIPEVLGMCDNVLVMREGRVAATFTHQEATPEKLLREMIGGSRN